MVSTLASSSAANSSDTGRACQPPLKIGPRWLWASTTPNRGFSMRCSGKRSLLTGR